VLSRLHIRNTGSANHPDSIPDPESLPRRTTARRRDKRLSMRIWYSTSKAVQEPIHSLFRFTFDSKILFDLVFYDGLQLEINQPAIPQISPWITS
jgi:hypothetical protein